MEGRPDTKCQILAAAAQCFTEKGFHASSIDDVATRVDATKGMVYHHYRSKIELFFDVYRVGMNALLEAVNKASQQPAPPMERICSMLHEHIQVMFSHHAFENVVAQAVQIHRYHALTPDQRSSLDVLMASRDQLEGMYRDVVMSGMADGEFDRGVDVSIAVKTMLGGVHWSLIWYRPDSCQDDQERRRLADQMVRILVKGLQTRTQDQFRSATDRELPYRTKIYF